MRKADVYLFDRLAGHIEEREPRGYRFWYDADYIKDPQALPLSHLMPLSDTVVETEALPAFFGGLDSRMYVWVHKDDVAKARPIAERLLKVEV